MRFQTLVTNRFVKGEDLNHHGTLFVCVKLHGMTFTRPIRLGEIARFEATPVYAGRSSIFTYICAKVGEEKLIEGFISYVNVDENGKAQPHGIVIEAESEEEKQLQERAMNLPRG